MSNWLSLRVERPIGSETRQSFMIMEKQGYIYILTNKDKTVFYIGVTSDLKRRVCQHKLGALSGFTKRCNVHYLVYYEVYDDMYNAIAREKQIKGGSRKKKITLIESMNPKWKDLYEEIAC